MDESGEIKQLPVKTLRTLLDKVKKEVVSKDRTHRLRTHPNSFVGSDAVGKIAEIGNVDRERAVEIGQQMLEIGFLKHVVDPEKPFLDSDSLYRFYPVPTDKEILEYVGDDWLNACITALDIDRKSQEWDFEKEVIENDFEAQTFTRKVKGEDLKAVKVVFKSKANPAKLIQLLHDEMVERHGEWGKGYIKGKVHYRVNDDVNIQHWEFSPGGVMRKRDFLVARRIVRQDNDGQIIIADRSIEHGCMPPRDEFIRCNLPYNIRVIVPLRDKDGNDYTEIHYMNKTDVRGWVPKSIVNAVNADLNIKELKKIGRICM